MVEDVKDRGRDESPSGQAESDPEPTAEKQLEESMDIPLDTIFDILRNQRRRLAIEYLRRKDTSTDLSELTEYIAAVENDKPVDDLTSSERKRVYVSLYQTHIPKMEDAGMLEFEQDRKGIDLLPLAKQLFPYLDIEGSQEESELRPHSHEGPGQRSAEVRDLAEQLRSFADRLEDWG